MTPEEAYAEAMQVLARKEGRRPRLPDWKLAPPRPPSRLDASILAVARRRASLTARQAGHAVGATANNARESLIRLERAGHLRRVIVRSSLDGRPCDAWEIA